MKLKYLLYAVLGCGLWTACNDEDAIVARETVIEPRFEFPQGTNEWDKTAEEIRESHGVYLIYEGYSTVDFSRAWTVTDGTSYFGEALSDEQVSLQMKFMKEHVFPYLPVKWARTTLPPYYFLIYDYRTVTLPSYSSGSVSKTSFTNYFNGIDFWVSSICNETNPQFPTEQEKLKEHRIRILKMILETAAGRGKIVMPASFNEGFDYSTPIVSYPPEDVNTMKNRGFMGPANGDVYKHGSWFSLSGITSYTNFISYLFAGIRYSDEEFLTLFPETTYPKSYKKRKLVIDYLKEEYNIDLEAMRQGPEL